MINIENGSIRNDKYKRKGMQRSEAVVLLSRWIILVFITILVLPSANVKMDGYSLLETLAAAVVYNSAVTVYIARGGGWNYTIFSYFDAIFITVISFFSGGINSDIYIFIFFLLGFCGISKDAGYTIRIGIFCAFIYSLSSIFAAGFAQNPFNISRLIIKDLLFIMGAFGISRINFEVKRYDELRKKEFRLARTDKLTGLANRHYFDQKLREEVEYADKADSTLNVLLFDLDNFKGFNDTYGHISGDKLLMLFSEIIMQCIRKSDIPVRYGGEEFLVLIRDLDLILAKSVGERIRRQLERQRMYLGAKDEKKKVTVSCGVSQYPLHSKNIKEVVEFADQALYYVKEHGKNAVLTYDEIGNAGKPAGN